MNSDHKPTWSDLLSSVPNRNLPKLLDHISQVVVPSVTVVNAHRA